MQIKDYPNVMDVMKYYYRSISTWKATFKTFIWNPEFPYRKDRSWIKTMLLGPNSQFSKLSSLAHACTNNSLMHFYPTLIISMIKSSIKKIKLSPILIRVIITRATVFIQWENCHSILFRKHYCTLYIGCAIWWWRRKLVTCGYQPIRIRDKTQDISSVTKGVYNSFPVNSVLLVLEMRVCLSSLHANGKGGGQNGVIFNIRTITFSIKIGFS